MTASTVGFEHGHLSATCHQSINENSAGALELERSGDGSVWTIASVSWISIVPGLSANWAGVLQLAKPNPNPLIINIFRTHSVPSVFAAIGGRPVIS
jgi:hypothetical protein